MTVSSELRDGATGLGMQLPESTLEQLSAYLALLTKWNRIYNLTAIRDEHKLVSHHLLDSLAVVNHLPQGRLLDAGTGAGFPGVPIALAQPARPVTLLDSIQKKTAFLKHVITELGMKNVRVETTRVEHYQPADLFEVVISRAFAELDDFIRIAGHLVSPTGVMVAMKGIYPDQEISAVRAPWRVRSVFPLDVPQLQAQRHLVLLDRITEQKADGQWPAYSR